MMMVMVLMMIHFASFCRYCVGFWGWCEPHSPYLRGLCPPTCHPSSWFGWSWSNWFLDEDSDRTWIFFYHLSRAWNCEGYEGKAGLHSPGLWARAWDGQNQLCSGEELWVAGWAGYHHWSWAFQVSRGVVPAIHGGNGSSGHSRNNIQLHNEMWCWHQERSVR